MRRCVFDAVSDCATDWGTPGVVGHDQHSELRDIDRGRLWLAEGFSAAFVRPRENLQKRKKIFSASCDGASTQESVTGLSIGDRELSMVGYEPGAGLMSEDPVEESR